VIKALKVIPLSEVKITAVQEKSNGLQQHLIRISHNYMFEYVHIQCVRAAAILTVSFETRFQTQEGTGKHLEDLQARAEKEIR
jgi:hypothetical protein